jgi:hypothetical protein
MSDQPVTETFIRKHTTRTTVRQSIPPAGFEHMISAGVRPPTHAGGRAAPETGLGVNKLHKQSDRKNTHRKVCIPTPHLPWRALNFFAQQKRKDITESKLNSLVRRIELYAFTQDMLGRREENQR